MSHSAEHFFQLQTTRREIGNALKQTRSLKTRNICSDPSRNFLSTAHASESKMMKFQNYRTNKLHALAEPVLNRDQVNWTEMRKSISLFCPKKRVKGDVSRNGRNIRTKTIPGSPLINDVIINTQGVGDALLVRT